MKKNDFKKLRLSRETLQILNNSEVEKVVGGSKFSCLSGGPLCVNQDTTTEGTDPGGC